VAPAEVIDAIADADLGLMLIEPVCRSYELTLPNKLFEYAAAGLPILASNLPVISRVVVYEQIGEAVLPSDVQSIAGAMRRLADPESSQSARQHIERFARRTTWEYERATLERVYQARGRSRA
jgi:glycosyltransferase involved in cell wall biosynthesis